MSFGSKSKCFCVVRLYAGMLCILAACHAAGATGSDTGPIRTILGGEYWGVDPTPEYVEYLRKVRPDVIHASVLGPELACTLDPQGRRKCVTPIYPEGMPSMREYITWWKEYLPAIQAAGIKVQATFSMTSVWGDHENNRGWFKYYNDMWEEDLLGPKPVEDPAELLELDADGNLLRDRPEGWAGYRGCVNNPHWRSVLKAMMRAGIEAGFDGFMVQFPYARCPGGCEYCQEGFRGFLGQRYSAQTLERKFGIRDLDRHKFEIHGPFATTARVPGELRPIDIEAREFSAVSVKKCFDEVFIDYGRKLKPDLVVSMWTHFRRFLTEGRPKSNAGPASLNDNVDFESFVDERDLLPIEEWGKGEAYTWYSDPVYRSHLESGIVGDATLSAKFMRAAGEGKPFVVQKYDYFRWRLTTMEAIALGGTAFGAAEGGWGGGSDVEEVHLRSYYDFIRRMDGYLRSRQSYAEVALVFPRTALYWGDCDFLEPFRRLGRGLIEGNILFDVLIDERITGETLAAYDVVVVPETRYLGGERERLLKEYDASRGAVRVAPREAGRGFSTMECDIENEDAVAAAVRKAAGGVLSGCDAPKTVQIHSDRQDDADRILVHLVNYDRRETGRGRREDPIPAEPVRVDLRLPRQVNVAGIGFMTPEAEGETELPFEQSDGRVKFTTPEFMVYGLAVVQFGEAGKE